MWSSVVFGFEVGVRLRRSAVVKTPAPAVRRPGRGRLAVLDTKRRGRASGGCWSPGVFGRALLATPDRLLGHSQEVNALFDMAGSCVEAS